MVFISCIPLLDSFKEYISCSICLSEASHPIPIGNPRWHGDLDLNCFEFLWGTQLNTFPLVQLFFFVSSFTFIHSAMCARQPINVFAWSCKITSVGYFSWKPIEGLFNKIYISEYLISNSSIGCQGTLFMVKFRLILVLNLISQHMYLHALTPAAAVPHRIINLRPAALHTSTKRRRGAANYPSAVIHAALNSAGAFAGDHQLPVVWMVLNWPKCRN